MRSRRGEAAEKYVHVTERLRPYFETSTERESEHAPPTAPPAPEIVLDEYMERALKLLTMLPWRQRRETIEDLLSPYDPARGRRAVDALIEASFVAEDYTGHLYLLV